MQTFAQRSNGVEAPGTPSGFLAPEPPTPPSQLEPGDYKAALVRYERDVIAEGLAQAQGRIRETCRLLGISRNMLRERMIRYGLRA
jgi:DNA-binding NtrC family response regulator